MWIDCIKSKSLKILILKHYFFVYSSQENFDDLSKCNETNDTGHMKLRQSEHYSFFEDVLNVSCVSGSNCLLGTSDNVIKFFK